MPAPLPGASEQPGVCRRGSGQGCRAGQPGAHRHAGLMVEQEPGDGGERAKLPGAAAEWTLAQRKQVAGREQGPRWGRRSVGSQESPPQDADWAAG